MSDRLTVAAAQVTPIWLDRARTTQKIAGWIGDAAARGASFVAFGEALLPGYPFWLEHTDGARFESPFQQELHAHYLDQAVQVEAGHLDPIREAARSHRIAAMLGIIERPRDRGGHSVYATLAYVDREGNVAGLHRKLMPTYEERLIWAAGDGHGLRTHPLAPFTLGGLNCWENWMPLPRAALYAEGEDLHVAVWPGSRRNTDDLTRFLAKEGRSYVISVSGLLRREDIPDSAPHAETLRSALPAVMADGGSCIAAPDGTWICEPVLGEERLMVATLDHRRVREARQNFDPAGHYARPDVTRLVVDRRRQSTLEVVESD
jgi:nitrilase